MTAFSGIDFYEREGFHDRPQDRLPSDERPTNNTVDLTAAGEVCIGVAAGESFATLTAPSKPPVLRCPCSPSVR